MSNYDTSNLLYYIHDIPKMCFINTTECPLVYHASLKYTFYPFFSITKWVLRGPFCIFGWAVSHLPSRNLHAKISNIFPSKFIRKVKVCNRMTDRAINNIPPPWIFDLRSIKRRGVDCTCVLITILYISVGLTTCVSNCDQQLI